MPNWAENYLISDKSFDEVLKKCSCIEGLDFNKIVPTPKDIYMGDIGQEEELKYGDKTWYKWRLKNWGTKWQPDTTDFHDNILFFLTAWSPPIPIIIALSKLFPEHTFEFLSFDIAMNWAFYLKIKAGRKLKEINYNDLEEATFSQIPAVLREKLTNCLEDSKDFNLLI